MKWLMIGFIRVWRAVVSPSYGPTCKYFPSCSEYGLEAVHVHGAIKGGWLTLWRIVRCNPWSHGGYDPVPDTKAAFLLELEEAGLAAGTAGDTGGAACQY